MKFFSTFLVVLFFTIGSAQVLDSTQIDEVIVKAKSIELSNQKKTAAISFVGKQEINRADPTIITPILNRVPGVFMQQGALNTNRITIRGIGARSPFSTNRLKAYLNNIPLTSANGETIIDDLDMEVLGQLEITKGPTSSQFGASIGGVIQLNMLELNSEKSFANYANLFGSYGLQKHSLQAGYSANNKQLVVSYHKLKQDGFRENSNYNRESLNVLSTLYSSPETSFDFISVLTELKAFIPSSVTQEVLENNPSAAASNWNAAQGFESYTRGLIGVTLNQKLATKWNNQSSIFINFKDAFEPRPFDILDENTVGLGFRTNFEWDAKIFNNDAKLNVGMELMQEWHATSNYENVYQSFPNQGSIQGDLFFYIDQNRFYQNYFSELIYQLSASWKLETGIHINSTSFTIEDRFLNDGNDQSSTQTYETAFNPRIGVSFEISEGKYLYANISRGFSVPTVSESLTPQGILNTNLLPEYAWNYEVGAKFNFYQQKLYTEVNLFSLQVDNLLVARRTAEDQFVGINAGKTNHNGIESLIKGNFAINEFLLQPYFSGSFNFFKFDEFLDGDEDFTENDLTGVPDMVLNLGLDWSWRNFQFFSNWNYVGPMPLNDANELYSSAFQLLNAKLTYAIPFTKKIHLLVNAGVNNLFNESYAASILPNAIGFGNSPARFFYPGLPRNYFFGAQINYNFL